VTFKPQDDQLAANLEVCDLLSEALRVHAKLRRGESIEERDRRTIAQLIRRLVAEWV